MKKFIVFLAATALVVSCSKLKDNEYEITGTIDPAFNGKKVYLEEQGGFMGSVPLDTAVVQDGKFTFKGTAAEPSMRLLGIEGKESDGKVFFILEEGEIEIKVDKDTLFNSVQGGTMNNEKMHEYFSLLTPIRKKAAAIDKKNKPLMQQAQMARDTAAISKLRKEYEPLQKENEKLTIDFVKNNPKAYFSVMVLRTVFGQIDNAEFKKLFDSLDPEVKKTKEGKEIEDALKKMEEQELAAKAVSVGKPAPDFTAATPDGKTLSLKQSLGKVTIIDFWASWCGPCRKENPSVVAMYNELHAKGLNIIGVSLDDNSDKWKEAIAADKLTWNHVSNLKKWEDPIAKQYGIQSIPATFVLDAQGNVVAKDLRGAELKAKVVELLAK